MKNSFILYDALISLILISSSILFFNKIILVNHQTTIKIDTQLRATEYLKNGIYHQDQIKKNEEFETYIKEGKYCVYAQKELCI